MVALRRDIRHRCRPPWCLRREPCQTSHLYTCDRDSSTICFHTPIQALLSPLHLPTPFPFAAACSCFSHAAMFYDASPKLVAAVLILCIPACTLFALRCYVRLTRTKWGMDDWMMAAAMVGLH